MSVIESIDTRLHRGAYFVKGPLLGSFKAKMSRAERFGKRPVILGKVVFQLAGRAVIGDDFIAQGHIFPISILAAPSGILTIGDNVIIGGGTVIEAWHDLRIGDNALIGPFSQIMDDDRHSVEPDSVLYKGPTIVGSNVWVGRNAAIMPGVSIGDGSVIGANSVVTKDIPPASFAAGAPARVIRKLELPNGWSRH